MAGLTTKKTRIIEIIFASGGSRWGLTTKKTRIIEIIFASGGSRWGLATKKTKKQEKSLFHAIL